MAIVAVILILFSRRATTSGLAFMLGWVVGLVIVMVILGLVVDDTATRVGNAPWRQPALSIVEALLGVVLLSLANREWRKRPKDEAHEPPSTLRTSIDKVTAGLDQVTPGRALSLGFALAAINPKNIALILALMVAMTHDEPLDPHPGPIMVMFIVVSSLSIAVPVLYRLVAGEHAQEMLANWKTWLINNYIAVMAGVLFVVGGVLLLRGLWGLIA